MFVCVSHGDVVLIFHNYLSANAKRLREDYRVQSFSHGLLLHSLRVAAISNSAFLLCEPGDDVLDLIGV